MTFTELMSLIALTTPFSCSVWSGWNAGKGFGVLTGLVVGLVLGIACFLGVRVISRWIGGHPKLRAPPQGTIWIGLSWLLAAALFAWILGFSFSGMWVARLVVR